MRTMNERMIAALSTFGNHAPFLITLVLLVQLPVICVALLGTVLGPSGAFFNLLAFVAFIMATPLWNGAIMVALGRIGDRGEIEIVEAYRASAAIYARLLPIYMLCMMAVFAGFLLLVIPGVYLGMRLCLAPFAGLFEKEEGIAAIRRSWNLTQRHLPELLVYFLIPVIPGMVLQFLRIMFLSVEPSGSMVALFNFVSQLTSMVTGLILLALLYQLYRDASRPQTPVATGHGEILYKPIDQMVKKMDDDG